MTVGIAPISVFDADLPTLTYEATETLAAVYPRIQEAQRQGPIALGPFGPEVLSYDLVRSVLREDRFGIPPGMNLVFQGITSGPLWDKMTSLPICLEGDVHRRIRSLISKAFTPRATLRLQDTMFTVMNELVDQVADAKSCDVVTDLARPYAVPIICALLGTPREDWEQFSLWTDQISKAFSLSGVSEIEPDIMRAWGELDDYADEMIRRRRHTLTDDMLSVLIQTEDGGNRLNAAELQMMVSGLLLGGTDTTRRQVSASVHLLSEHPEQWDLLTDRPELAMRAAEETLRHSPIAAGVLRQATVDTELEGYIFPAGTMVLLNTAAANRDPAVYNEPSRVDIAREDAPPALIFGGGNHYCLGANLARRELAVALTVLTRRMRNLRLAGPAPWGPMMTISGPMTVPIEFEPTS